MQRASRARVWVDGKTVGEIRAGLCCLIGVTHDDDHKKAKKLAEKLWHLRVFDDEEGKTNRSAAETNGEVLIVSQFTLYGDTQRGRRPSYTAAASSAQADKLINHLVKELQNLGATVETGTFGAHMKLELVNDGPITLLIEI